MMEGSIMEENEVVTTKNGTTIVKKSVTKGLSFGSALAMVISYCAWHSVGWAILHGIFGWFYVLYYVIKY